MTTRDEDNFQVFDLGDPTNPLPLDAEEGAAGDLGRTRLDAPDFGFRSSNGPDLVIIREIYDTPPRGQDLTGIHERWEADLETAVSNMVTRIVIEPTDLGEETSRWIRVGNCLHKTAVLSGLASIAVCALWPQKTWTYCSLTGISLATAGLYTISWQSDPCSKYQVDTSTAAQYLQPSLGVQALKSSMPVVLVKRDDTLRKILHSIVSASALFSTTGRVLTFYK